jgi:hypothetical protein
MQYNPYPATAPPPQPGAGKDFISIYLVSLSVDAFEVGLNIQCHTKLNIDNIVF